LTLAIRSTRLSITDYFAQTHAALQSGVDQWISWETSAKSAFNKLKSLEQDNSQDWAKNWFFVLIAGLGGSIMTKKSEFGFF
jgi:hypothetical protein